MIGLGIYAIWNPHNRVFLPGTWLHYPASFFLVKCVIYWVYSWCKWKLSREDVDMQQKRSSVREMLMLLESHSKLAVIGWPSKNSTRFLNGSWNWSTSHMHMPWKFMSYINLYVSKVSGCAPMGADHDLSPTIFVFLEVEEDAEQYHRGSSGSG